jgi:glucose/arabinose dehydrogenase
MLTLILSLVPPAYAVELHGHRFTLPAGFAVERVPLPAGLRFPVAATFDPAGDLFVTEASGTNAPVAKQARELPHRLWRLPAGRFDQGAVFADRLMLPQGVMCLDRAVFVAAPPTITRFADGTRGVWHDGRTLTGCANDLHGPYAGIDGWVYWTKGAFAEQRFTLPTGKPFRTKAAHIYRARPDGTGREPVFPAGMDNPVDVVSLPGGERFVAGTFLQHPADGKRDGLIHAVYGGIWGKDHAPATGHPWTAPTLMPPMTHLGPAAPSGLHRYDAATFGPSLTDNLFCAQFNLRTVSRHVLVPDGATFRTLDTDFLVSDNLDFHPTDVIENSDGNLLVIDTGGWYKLCCPTSQF